MTTPGGKKTLGDRSIRYTIFTYFTVSALVAVLLVGISLYTRMSGQLTEVLQEKNQSMLNQVNRSIDSYLRTVMKLSDSLYYGAIKNMDISSPSVKIAMNLLYENNRDSIENITLFSREGELLGAAPAARLKEGVEVVREDWFTTALEKTENQHFGMPRVRHIFEDDGNKYRWVIPLSRAVELTRGTSADQGVLLISINYSSLKHLMEDAAPGRSGYIYLMNREGELIYHPRIQLLDSGIGKENNKAAASYRDGNHFETFEGVKRLVTVKSVGYTGWKLVGVTPRTGVSLNSLKNQLFVVFITALFLFILTLINGYISSRITDPIKELEKSVNELESGELDAEVYIGGSYEIRHLGSSIANMARQIKVLMNDIVAEHESKRKSEFDTLQSQINPHFLYNTLDIIVWMIENEQKEQAVKAVTALARFFRISLSRGRSIIPVRDELEHVRNYLMIQNMRYKNRFTYELEAEEEVLELSSLKLMLQPLVENAIYHGMEFMDGDGEIRVRAYREAGELYMTVRDNGLGMTGEQAESLLTEERTADSGKGSGIGVRNVNERIRLYFGEGYGLSIESEPDVGTTVTIRLPSIPYSAILEREKNHDNKT